MPERATIFIDGNNWYHGLRTIGLTDLGRLDYAKISRKLVGPARSWQATRYYIGQVNQSEEPRQYADQRRFLSRLTATDPRLSYHLGRLETRTISNDVAIALLRKLHDLPSRIDRDLYHELMDLALTNKRVPVKVEKAVDVQLAVDMVVHAHRDLYDTAYLLSADGDLTPAVTEARALGKKVLIASALRGAQLAMVANTAIPLRVEWFRDCWL